MTTTMTAADTLTQIREAAQLCDADTKYVRAISSGQAVRQGDVYLERIESAPEGWAETSERQLAPGTSQGSRHVAEGQVRVLVGHDPGPLQGPVIVARARWTLRHPEHADVSMPAGTYRVTYQRDHAAEELRRIAD